MCGIFALLNEMNISNALSEFNKGKHRGPESTETAIYNNLLLGFHRLAINGLDDISNQPIIINKKALICNGEIYNYKALYNQLNIVPKTNSDCEIILHMYEKFGIKQTLHMLDGVFAFVLYDFSSTPNKIYVARDPFGVRPLYTLTQKCNNYTPVGIPTGVLPIYGFASELKCLSNIYDSNNTISQYEPGSYSIFQLSQSCGSWIPIKENVKYFIPTFSHNIYYNNEAIYYNNISKYLTNAVYKRCLTTDRPIACLLSGGLDSSLITALVDNFFKVNYENKQLETYSIGLYGSEDLKHAQLVAEYLSTKHTEIIVSEDDMFNAIPEVIYNIESYDTTTVRASLGNYLLGKYIAKHSDAKVIFNGDGSDELLGGYLYMHKCTSDIEFDRETRRLLKDIHLFDVLRSDKSISSNGLEPRTPFLDKNFVNYILSLPISFRNHNNQKQIEKFILRNSFSPNNFLNHNGNDLLPSEILWRKKEAFSDGVSVAGNSLYQILQKKIAMKLNEDNLVSSGALPKYEADINTEKYYYKTIFESKFTNRLNILPYYWMPKYTNAIDPSARTLQFYT
jgi:asparagine synthase (glutamine-hydrolysing)